MDFGINSRLVPSDYVGLDLTSVRELKKAQEGEKIQPKKQSDAGSIARGQQSLEQQVQALERASRKLETADHTVHQVEDLLHDALNGFRANRAEDRPTSANERLLKSADATAQDIVGFARFDEEVLFPPSASPIKFDEKKALGAYAQHEAALREQRGATDLPEVADVLSKTNRRLRGEGGVLPTLGSLAESGARDPDATDRTLTGLKTGVGDSRREIAAVHKSVDAKRASAEPGPHIDVAS